MLTFEELLALWNDEATRGEMTHEQLDALAAHLQEYARDLLDGERTDEVLAELAEIAEAVEAIDVAVVAVVAAEAEAAARADELATRIFGADGGDGEGGEGGETPADEGGEGGDAPAETPPAETPAETPEVEVEVEVEVETNSDERVPVAASGAARRALRITNVSARRPASTRPRATAGRAPSALVASANLGGVIAAGQPIDSAEDLSAAFMAAWEMGRGYRGPSVKISVARAGGDPLSLYGEDRTLDGDARRNHSKIERLTNPQAIIAAGGRCVPSPVSYDQPAIVGTQARPMRDDGMVRFGADRGGVKTLAPAVLTDLTGAISDWSMDNDADPGSDGNATKPCLTMTCPDETEDVVDAIVRCIKIGNFRSRFFGEQVQEWIDLAAVWQARHAERKLIQRVHDDSTHVTVGQTLGTSRDMLAMLERITASFYSRHRAAEGYPLHWDAPRWLRDMWVTDIVRQMPVGTVDETLAYSDAQIDRALAQRNVNVTWLLDGVAGQEFGPQADGALVGWPDVVESYLYPEGSWQFLDGGMFDFGIMRDTVNTGTNDFQIFAETLEGAHFHGVETFRITSDVCPDGSASALVDINPCATGS